MSVNNYFNQMEKITGNGKKAVVIGASSGIGREVAKLLIAEGWTVGVAARREDKLKTLNATAYERIDVTDENASKGLHRLIDSIGGMDLFFYASGIGRQNRQLQEDIEIATMQTNAVGFTRMIGEAYRYFADTGQQGHIAAITSIAGTKGLGPAPSYSATKAMQATYLQALEQQARQRKLNIWFTDIRPGFVDTDLLSDTFHYPMLMKADKVAKDIIRALRCKRHVRIIDWRYRLLTAAWRLIPCPIWRRMKI